MKQNKLFSAAIALLLIAFFTTSWVFPTPAHKPTAVTIYVPFDFVRPTATGAFFTGHFTATGALATEGDATMDAAILNPGVTVYHCLWTLTDGNGTFTLREDCELAASTWQGRWQIISGTGAYANLRGNGSSLMPATYRGVASPFWEVLTGVIY